MRKSLSRVEPATGKVRWTTELPGFYKFEASPLAADGRIYLMNFAGEVVVVGAADGEIRSTIPMGESNDNYIRSSLIAAHGDIFVRTNSALYCISEP